MKWNPIALFLFVVRVGSLVGSPPPIPLHCMIVGDRQDSGIEVYPPWSRSPSGSQRAWANALDVACGAADGESQERGAVAAITRHLFHNMGFSYNSLDSGAKYSGFGDFHLTSYLDTLSYLAGSNRLVNCIDQANGLTTLVNVLGIPATVLRVEPFGYIKPTNVVGVNGMCNNPIFGAEDSPDVPLCSDDDVFRSAFGYHAVTYTKWGIYDATLGPVVGLPYQSYISTIIDASTAEEYAASVFAAGTNSNTCTYSVIDVLR